MEGDNAFRSHVKEMNSTDICSGRRAMKLTLNPHPLQNQKPKDAAPKVKIAYLPCAIRPGCKCSPEGWHKSHRYIEESGENSGLGVNLHP